MSSMNSQPSSPTAHSLPVTAKAEYKGDSARESRNGRSVDSTALLQGDKAVDIVHNGAIYRLQSTKLGKLILTK